MRIDRNIPKAARNHRFDLDRFAQCPAQQVVHGAQLPGRVDHDRCERLLTAEGKQLGGELGATINGVDGVTEPLGAPAITAVPAFEQFEIAPKHLQYVVEVMRNAAGEFAQRFHLLGLEQRSLRLLELLAGASPLRNVAGDLRKPDQLTLFVDGIDDDVREETASITPYAPAFGLESSFAPRRLQAPERHAGRNILGRIEPRKVRTDDLVFGIALDASGAGIPACDVPVGRQHEDGVVRHALNQQPEAPLAFEHGVMSSLLLAHIADHGAEPDQRVVAVAQCRHGHVRPEECAVLADAPSLLDVPPCLGGGVQRGLRRTQGSVLRRIQKCQRLANNLVRPVALHALAARVPRHDNAVRRQCKDGVIQGGLSPQPEPG